MSSNDIDSESESTDIEDLAKRVEDLEVEVYGYGRSDNLSAGENIVVNLKQTIVFCEKHQRRQASEDEQYTGAPIEQIYDVAEVLGMDRSLAKQAYEKLRRQGEVYEVQSGMVRST